MRILIISHDLPSLENSNTDAPIARQIESLRKCGIDIDGVELLGARKIKYLMILPRFLQSVRKDIDLVHAHYGFVGMLARMQWRKPLVVSFMGSDLLGTPDNRGRLETLSRVEILANRFLARFVDSIIVKSEEMARVLSPLQVNVIPNGVDLDAFLPIEKKEALRILGWLDDRIYVLFPGDPQTPRKGFPFAREAIHLAAKKIGKPIEIKTLFQVPHPQVPYYMNACDLVVMTSYIEGSPNVIKEAMACNRPIVSVSVGDTKELLGDVPGCTIVARENNAFADAIAAALSDNREAGGREAIVEKGLDLMSVARRIIAVYEDVLERRK